MRIFPEVYLGSDSTKSASSEAFKNTYNLGEKTITTRRRVGIGLAIGTLVGGTGIIMDVLKETAHNVKDSVAGHVFSPDLLHYSNDIAIAGSSIIGLSMVYAIGKAVQFTNDEVRFQQGYADAVAKYSPTINESTPEHV